MSDRYVVISGCSGGGKSTLLAELRRRGHNAVEEPGRRIVREELKAGGRALPWADAEDFLRRTIDTAIADLEAAKAKPGWVFFDRGVVDAASALEHLTGKPMLETMGRSYRYHPAVFLAPPWPEIYVNDPERRHGFDAGVAEFERLERAYPMLGYRVILLPRASAAERADLVLAHLLR
jgi:predicted ATPase